MGRLIIIIFSISLFSFFGCSNEESINGAGASFPAPLYRAWAIYFGNNNRTKIKYDSIGSAEGLKRIISGEVDFGASDCPLSKDELEKYDLFQLPTTIGGVVPGVNIPGIRSGEMVLTGEVLADIYLGNITSWNDPAITSINPKLSLPNRKINVIHRSDGSGTTWLFTKYLALVSKKWADNIKPGMYIKWPVGKGASRNSGIIRKITETQSSIGYVEYTYAEQSGIAIVLLKSRIGETVRANLQSFINASLNANGNFELLDVKAENAWPITGYTFVVLPKKASSAKAAKLLRFFTWCMDEGGDIAMRLSYVPCSSEIAERNVFKLRKYYADIFRPKMKR